MHFIQKDFFVLTVALLAVWSGMCDVKDTGYATNCGKEAFNMSWTPKVLSDKGSINIAVQYVSAYDLNGGSYKLDVFIHGDPTPFLNYEDSFTCADVQSYLNCPVKKGDTINKTFTISKTKYLVSFPGRYTVIAEIKNEKKQQMFCAKLDVTVNNNKA